MKKANELLTLVLPLKGRAEFTFRIMEFLDRSKFPFKLIIADGGDNEAVSKVLSREENFPNVDYRYIKYPFDESYSHYYRKMVSALSEVRTPYVSLIDNDCFPVLEGLNESVIFLESHPAYSACRGQHIDFKLEPFPGGDDDPLYGQAISIGLVYFDRNHTIWRSFESDNPLERILDWSHCMNIMHYSVYRINILTAAYAFISKNDCCDLIFCETAFALTALAYGKTRVIETPSIIRQQNSPESASKEMISKMDILDRMFLEKWTRDLNQLIKDVAIKVSEVGGCLESEANSRIRLALKNHYADRLYTYLERRERSKRAISEDEIDMPRKASEDHVSEPFSLSQFTEIEKKLRGQTAFLTRDQSDAPSAFRTAIDEQKHCFEIKDRTGI